MLLKGLISLFSQLVVQLQQNTHHMLLKLVWVVVNNTSYFRQNPDVPLVVPEVNAHALDAHNGIIAYPNCSTIQMMVALEPVRQKMGLGPYHRFNLSSCFQVLVAAILETQRELREVLNDGVDPMDLLRKSRHQVAIRNITNCLQRPSSNRRLHR